ncbi:malectin domain-containing carbohydrate-binding protein [Hymenobacter wooponensis]|nr:malectin domain-containing carbohydrate-binding protein [Hymenobacter wooponensis]
MATALALPQGSMALPLSEASPTALHQHRPETWLAPWSGTYTAPPTAAALAKAQADVYRRSFLLEPSRRTAQAQSWTAHNVPGHLQAQLEADAYTLSPVPATVGSPTWQVRWTLRGLGRAGKMSFLPVAEALVQVQENVVRFHHGQAFAVEYVNSPEGIRQNFHVAQRPQGNAGPVEVVLALHTALQPRQTSPEELVFQTRPDAPKVLTYNGLKAWDATGRVLATSLHLDRNRTLRLTVDDAGATYPLTIDPLSTTPFISLTGEKNVPSFGSSVASAGDVNGDGYGDVIVGAYAQNLAYVYYGSRTGITTNASSRLNNPGGGNFGFSVSSAGDLNGDGYSDVIVGAPVEGRSYIYYGSRTGLTGRVGTTLVGEIGSTSFGFSVARAGDVNRDGLSDVVVGAEAYNRGQGRAYVFYGTRTGLGTTVAASSAGLVLTGETIFSGFGYSVAGAGDVNRDGYDDIVVGAYAYNGFQGRAYLFMGSSTGTSPTAGSTLTGQAALTNFGASVAGAGDVNGDGYADVLIGAAANQLEQRRAYLYYGSSQGLPTTPGTTLTPDLSQTEQFGNIVGGAGDINRDGFGDFIVGASQANAGQVYVYYGRSAGLPATVAASEAGTRLTANPGDGHYGNGVAGAGDVNGDGYSDVVVGARGINYMADWGTIYVYAGSASPPPAPLLTSLAPQRNAIAAPRSTAVTVRFDQPLSGGDATLKALQVYGQQSGGKRLEPATVSGNTLTLTPARRFAPGETVWATLTTALQNASSTPLAQPHVFQFTAATASASATFSAGTDVSVSAGSSQVVAGDIDGDGDLDLLTASRSLVSVSLNTGKGTFQPGQQLAIEGTGALALADLDGDGDLDLVVGAAAPDASHPSLLRVYLNSGSPGGLFNSGTTTSTKSSHITSLAVADLDGDGDLDIVAGGTMLSLQIALNNGSGSLIAAENGWQGNQVALGDLDNDGDVDLLAADSLNNRVQVVTNLGKASFMNGPSFAIDRPIGLALGDVDSDGDLDVVVASKGSTTASVRLNNGGGIFSGTVNVPVGSPSTVNLADLDGDGDLDLLTTNGNNTLSVRLNNRQGNFSGTQDVAVGAGPTRLALGDLDGDGDLDFATANGGSATASIRLNQAASTSVYRLNSGGPAVTTPQGEFAADAYFTPTPGATYSTTVAINGTNDDALYQTERYGPDGTLSYQLPVANGTYRVVLHFAELYWNEAGKRLFDLNLENTTVLDNYDIFAKAGVNTAISETFTVTVTDGLLNLDLSSLPQVGGRDSPKLSALEVRPLESIYQVNSGGPSLNTDLGLFAADDYFSPAPGTTYSTTARIAGTPDDALYQTERYGSTGQLRYALPITNGTYQVVLHFAEIYWSGPGQRIFDVSLEGARVLDNYDIFAKAGANTAITETFTATVTDGILNLDMSSLSQDGGVDYPKLSALQILPASLPTAEISTLKELQAYPNPSVGAFTVALFSAKDQTATLTLTDGVGRVMQEQQVPLHTGVNHVPVKAFNLSEGLYHLSLRPQVGTPMRTKVLFRP